MKKETQSCVVFVVRVVTPNGSPGVGEHELDRLREYGAAELVSVYRRGGKTVYRVAYALPARDAAEGGCDSFSSISDLGDTIVESVRVSHQDLQRVKLTEK